MADLRLGVILYRLVLVEIVGTATIEVSNLTLLDSGNEFGSKRQADGLPTLRGSLGIIPYRLDVYFRLALIPHVCTVMGTFIGIFDKVITYRTIEVLLIHE